ncbi:sensor histidine kinase [Mucilaginibacter phyllosphaerae]|uniref:Histidine kinase n=1 Tax=Mucilaginibacter phyllosphaerae TaxID=1812349 RepID=A0A4Y8AFU6_9SPHI|nr:histidine kinase [Mucilaginibacter phyllosphaerae]MBB3968734.1 hypothetical protein [Mucilaginibacter phyllosphaerae]TEW67630.1 histidine kinase [Mucilaginibacter phyllosphaerae]GGH14195.1 histidine kinase [Mucilaginibacter phyllosphaerae]
MDLRNEPATVTNDYILQFVTHRRYRIYRHAALLLFLSAVFFSQKDVLTEPANTYLKTGIFCFMIIIFYFNIYWLIPKMIFGGRYLTYLIWVVTIISIMVITMSVCEGYIRPYLKSPFNHHPPPSVLPLSIGIIVFIAASSAIKLFQQSVIVSQRVYELENLTTQTELEQLKNQINPHFLFNMLNNVNVLTQTDPEKASSVLIRLSELLRYQLYDSTRNKVLLTSDISFLKDFLNLESIRRDNFEFKIDTHGDLNGVQVSPLLFITFVENAVKHNMDAENLSFVHLNFTKNGDKLAFTCVNSKPAKPTARRMNGGLGLANVQRRLELLYPNRHFLNISDSDDIFNVELKLTV